MNAPLYIMTALTAYGAKAVIEQGRVRLVCREPLPAELQLAAKVVRLGVLRGRPDQVREVGVRLLDPVGPEPDLGAEPAGRRRVRVEVHRPAGVRERLVLVAQCEVAAGAVIEGVGRRRVEVDRTVQVVDRANCEPWDRPLEERECPRWEEVVR